MKTLYDVQQQLKQYGTFIYTGNRLADLELMMDEVRQLHQSQLIDKDDFQMALLLLKQEYAKRTDG
ncbi:YqgQ family protein [Bacillus carboniphilus]|uniref:YqgQ family protein n=1 Tax=Bacillus carboniphilus TaxID=86663 RepID=A0ABY9JX19_9BACI|nr:YqgQ family protein [Bacillus carboniphilus]WLR43939.1 YqgQ family protein [Bacillus carboniphilus]